MKNFKFPLLVTWLIICLFATSSFAQNAVEVKPAEEPPTNQLICTVVEPIAFGQTVNGTFVSSDCIGSRGANHRADEFSFTGRAGQQIVISMISDEINNPGNSVDSYVILRRSNGTVVAFDDDGGTNGSAGTVRNARVPAITGFFTLPADDTYFLEATTFAANEFGAYSLTLVNGGVPPCTTNFIGYTLPLQTQNGQLATTDCVSRGQFYTDKYAFEGLAGQNIIINMTSTQVDSYLVLRGPNNTTVLREDNDGGGGTNARITFTLPANGVYIIDATTNLENQVGSYALTLDINIGTRVPVSISTTNVTRGTQITVPITVGALPATSASNAVRSFEFTFRYNPSVLRPVSTLPTATPPLTGISQTGTLSQPFGCNTNPFPTAADPQPNPGQVQVACFGSGGTPITGSGTLINLVFDVIGNNGTSSPLQLPFFQFNENNPLNFIFAGGVIVNQNRMTGNTYYYFGTSSTGTPKQISASQVTAQGNPVVQSDSNVRGAYALEGLGAGPYSVQARKFGDRPGLGGAPIPGQPLPITNLDAQWTNEFAVGIRTLSLNMQRAADVSDNGTVTAFDAALISAWAVGNAIAGNRSGDWRFVNPTGGYNVPQAYTAAQIATNPNNQNHLGILLGDVTGNWEQPCVPVGNPICTPAPLDNAVSVSLPSGMNGGNGEYIEIPITAGELTNRGAVSYDFDVRFNPNVLRPVSAPIVQTGTLSNGFNIAFNAAETGRLRVGGYGLQALTGSGPLLKLRFEVIGSPGSSSELRWHFFQFNEGNPASTAQHGTFAVSGRTRFDFDGDGKSDVSVYRNGTWFVNRSSAGFMGEAFGTGTDRLAPADYNGDGITDLAVFRSGNWYIKEGTGVRSVSFGQAGDLLVPADYDGDGKADVAVFRPSNGGWYRINSGNGQVVIANFGQNGDVPTVGDYDGDGKADVSLFRPSNGGWYRINSGNGQVVIANFGQNGDIAVPADFDGDGRTDIAVFRSSNGGWYRINSSNGQLAATTFGQNGDVPVAADYDGDGRADVGVFRNGNWYVLRSGNGAIHAEGFGLGTDMAVPSVYVP